MAKKTSYSATYVLFSVLLLLLLLLLLRRPNIFHSTEEYPRCGCPGTDLTKASVSEGSGAGIPFIKRSYSALGGRNTLISWKSRNSLVFAAATVVLYGGTVAVFAYLCLKSVDFSGQQMSLVASILYPSAMDDFDNPDHILSRRRIRAHQSHLPKVR